MTLAHIHAHSEFSPLDGLSRCSEIAGRAAADGNPAAFITDHGNCAGHPEFQRACDKAGVKAGFGMEAYWVPDRRVRPEAGNADAQKRLRDNRHLILLARGQKGLRDLWALSTDAYVTGQYYKPRCDWETLEQYGSDLIVTTSCLGGIISRELLSSRFADAARWLDRLRSLFRGRLYLEIQPNAQPEQIALNKLLVMVAEQAGLPLVAASDSHYPSRDQMNLHATWMSCQTSKANEDYWHFDPMHPEDELRGGLAYLDERVVDDAIRNTVLIAEQCDARIGGQADPPVFGSSAEEDNRWLWDRCRAGLMTVQFRGGTKEDYAARLQEEFALVSQKNLAGCYLIVEDICRWTREQGILIGPGRGSAAASLMSYLLGITISDPLEAGLMFSRFLTPGRTALPDFDMDFPSSSREKIQARVIERYGAANVVRVGTHLRYRSKGILNKLFSLNMDQLPPEAFPDSRAIAAIIDEAESHTAGLGLPWEELLDQNSDQLKNFLAKYAAIFDTAGKLVGRLHAWGQHPAGLVISTNVPLEGTIPMRIEGGQLVSQWDFRDMEAQGLLKLDFLTLRTLDSVQAAVELIRQRTGTTIDPTRWDSEYHDPQVWEEISSGHTLGMFQVETSLGMHACRRMQPESMAELADLITLVRPGPRNSGMAESYLRRRAGDEEVDYPHERLQEHLAQRFGVMLYQEDILRACTVLAGYDGAEADAVRKVLGKKLTDKIDEAGLKFCERCEANGVARAEAEELWAKMAEFGRYAFNLAHAYSYAVLSYWTAWLKTHYPVETITAICSTLEDKDRIAPFVTEARRLGARVLGPDVNAHARGFRANGVEIRYGLDAIKGIGPQALAAIERWQPFGSWQELHQHAPNAGITLALARAGALDGIAPTRRGLIQYLEAERSGDFVRCVHKDVTVRGPNDLPCTYDWTSDPPLIRISPKTGRTLKPIERPPPKRCTTACRHYQPPAQRGVEYAEFSPEEMWRLEHEIYGTWLSDGIFRCLDEIAPGGRALAREIGEMWERLPEGPYIIPGVIASRRMTLTRKSSKMVWLTLGLESSYIDMAAFSPRDPDEPDPVTALRFLQEGTLVLVTAERRRYKSKGMTRMSSRVISVRRL